MKLRFLILLFVAGLSLAATVVPSTRVRESIPVREAAGGDAAEVARLRVGEVATFLDAVPRWYRIEMQDGTVGYVSKAWSSLREAEVAGFAVHFVDVGTGDGIVIDMGDREIVIDGGWEHSPLTTYAEEHDLIQWPIELVIVTHADYDHWNGLRRLLGFDGKRIRPQPSVLEFWEPGYDRECNPRESFERFLADMRAIPGIVYRRPLEDSFLPAVIDASGQGFSLPALPGAVFTLLHSDQSPERPNNGLCGYRINNASIVFRLDLNGHRFLFTGDANGKESLLSKLAAEAPPNEL